ncbi:Uncharacterized protein GBIM_13091 [Gryllus bimaculatus]|nr:Uncharacterized protein GBIM_13091 [Gryllus bimaculatus]
MLPVLEKLRWLYQPYVLGVVSVGYVLGELGHYLIGVTSKEMAIDLHFGDITCQFNSSEFTVEELPVKCPEANNSDVCESLALNGTPYCEWNYNGLGLDYQVLAGPCFIAVFTVAGVIMGIVADRYNRVRCLAVCTLVFSIAIVLTGAVKEYWQLVLLRIIMAAGESGCNPLATGVLSDIFPEEKRGLVMSIFNWGIYGGYGIAFPVGRYIPRLNAWDLGWRVCYYGAGIIALIVAVITGLTLREPERQTIGEETANAAAAAPAADGGENGAAQGAGAPKPLTGAAAWKRIVADSVANQGTHVMSGCSAFAPTEYLTRHNDRGMCLAYNCDLYYEYYFPDYDLGWWLFAITIVVGSVGVVFGGVLSDKFVATMGIRSRVAVLVISQLIATPFAFGSVYFGPLGAMITLGISIFFAEMWFGIVFAILVEIVPLSVRSTTVGIFLFVMNNVGGNLPILVEPVSKAIGYREALYIFYAGAYLVSSGMFLITMFMMGPGAKDKEKDKPALDAGHDNVGFTLEQIANGNGVVNGISAMESSRL